MIKKIVIRYNCVDNTTKEINISYILDNEINLSFPLLVMREIINNIKENDMLEMPAAIMITTEIRIKENKMFNIEEDIIERSIKKELYKSVINNPNYTNSLIISDLIEFLYNINYYIKELANYDNITKKGISFG